MKKRYVAVLLAVAMLALAGCGSKTADTEDTEKNTSEEAGDSTDGKAEESGYTPVLYKDLTSTIVKLGEYKGIEAVKDTAEVTDEDVRTELLNIKKNYGELVDVDRAAENGDVVVIDFTGYVDGETSDSLQGTEYSLELGSGKFVPGFEEQLIGAVAEEDREVNLTFPENYYEDMAGKDARFEVYVHKVQSYEVEGWGDDFVKENLEYDSVAQLEEGIRQELLTNAEQEAETNLGYNLIENLIEGSEYEIQDADVEAYLNQMMNSYESNAAYYGIDLNTYLQTYMGVTEAQLQEILKESAEVRVKMTLTVQEIAKLEGMEISDGEYKERRDSLAEQYGYADGAALEAAYSADMIREQIMQEKVLDLLRENAVLL